MAITFRELPDAESGRNFKEKLSEPCRILSRLSRRPQGGPATTAQLEPRSGSSRAIRHVGSRRGTPEVPSASGALVLRRQPPVVHAAASVENQLTHGGSWVRTGESLGA